MYKLSAFIIAKNEAHRIKRAIDSIRDVASEVIVVDSGSTDDTVEIAKSLGAKVIFNEWLGYVNQKSYAESLCKHNWVLNIDADEELTKDLQGEIKFIFGSKNQDRYIAYKMQVMILHRKDTMPRPMAPYNTCIRLYNKNYCSFSNTVGSTTKDSVSFNKDVSSEHKIYTLNGRAYHRSGTSIEQLTAKANFYSSEQAKDINNAQRHISALRVAFEFPFCFLKAFFKRRYFVFGFDGFVDSMIFAFARFLRMAKARENQQKNKAQHVPHAKNAEK